MLTSFRCHYGSCITDATCEEILPRDYECQDQENSPKGNTEISAILFHNNKNCNKFIITTNNLRIFARTSRDALQM